VLAEEFGEIVTAAGRGEERAIVGSESCRHCCRDYIAGQDGRREFFMLGNTIHS
jgi:hypothetical protein